MAAPKPGISALAVAIAAAGGILVFAAVKGISFTSGLKVALSGHVPSDLNVPLDPATELNTEAPGAAGSGSENGGAGGIIGGAINAATGTPALADAGTKYVGTGSVYKWGGGSPTKGWDCSGFVNYCLGHDLAGRIPGYGPGKFTGAAHGPTTAMWAVWTGATTIPRSQVQAGDLCIWPAFHMGIAISSDTMVNCPGPNGTAAPVLHKIDGGGRGILVCRRLKAI